MRDLGYDAPEESYKTHTIMGKTFDPADHVGYIESFAIGRN